MSYKITKTETHISILGDYQEFTEADLKELWEEHKVLYREGGIMAVWVEERDGYSPLIHLMGEDDGHIFWRKEEDTCFDAYWLDNYLETLKVVKDKISNGI